MPTAFPFQAQVYPRDEGVYQRPGGFFTHARKIVEQITRNIRTAKVDWEAGERKLQEELDMLLAVHAPSETYDHHRKLNTGNYAEVKISYPQWPRGVIVGYVGSDTADLAGSDFKLVGDFDINLLKRASMDIAMAIDEYAFLFICDNCGLHARIYPDTISEAHEYIHFREPSYRVNGEPVEIHPCGNWNKITRHAITEWLKAEKWGSGYENVLREFASAEEFTESAIAEFSAIGTVRRAWTYETPGLQFGIMLDHADAESRNWVTMIDLLGVEKVFVKS